MSKRKIHEYKGPKGITRVYFDSDLSEYVVQFFNGITGKHRRAADYFTSEKSDAIDTAAVMAGYLLKKNPRTRAKKSARTPTLAEMRKAYGAAPVKRTKTEQRTAASKANAKYRKMVAKRKKKSVKSKLHVGISGSYIGFRNTPKSKQYHVESGATAHGPWKLICSFNSLADAKQYAKARNRIDNAHGFWRVCD